MSGMSKCLECPLVDLCKLQRDFEGFSVMSTFLLKPFISSHDVYALRLYVLISLHLKYKMNKMGLEGHLEYMHLLTIAATLFHVSGHFKTTVDFHLVASLFCRMPATGCRFTGWSMVMGESSTWMMCFAMWLMTKTGWVDMKSLKFSFFFCFPKHRKCSLTRQIRDFVVHQSASYRFLDFH